MNIREAVESDLKSICLLSDEINKDHHANLPRYFIKPLGKNSDWDLWKSYIDKNESVIYVAENKGNIIGYISAQFINTKHISFLVPMKKCHIGTVVVTKKSRKLGVGRKLVNTVIREASDRGIEELVLEVMQFNAGAKKFYQSLGFEVFSTKLTKII